MRKTTIILATLLILLCLISYKFYDVYLTSLTDSGDSENAVDVILILEHRDAEGRLIEIRVKTGDLILENYGRFLSSMLGGSKQIRDTGGTWKQSTDGTYLATQAYASHILLGNGTAAAALEDYAMASQIATARVSSIGVTVSGNQVNATLSASFTFAASYTIREIGLRGRIYRSAASEYYYFLICRDDLSSNPITVASGDTLTVTYVFRLN
jgi:hypothetical protein